MRSDVRTYTHDLANVVGTMLATSGVGVTRSADSAATRSAFETIAASARRAGDLIERLNHAATVSEQGSDSAYERDLEYLERIHPPLDEVTAELERSGRAEGVPIVDRDSGRFLAVLVAAVAPQRILEIGTAFGYSALWMSKAQGPSGRLVTIDPDERRTAIASSFFKRAGVADRIEIVNRPALDVLPTLPRESFDLVFIDALKEEYPQYLVAAVPLLKKRGVLLADNVLWGHAASLPAASSDPQTTQAIRRFNEELLGHPALEATILPVGDGLGFAVKR